MYEGHQIIGQQIGVGYAAGGAMKGAILGCDKEVRQAEIPNQMGRLEQMLKGCLQGLDTLSGRLESTVMRSESPTTACDDKPQVNPNTPYGSRLQELTSMAEAVNGRIQSLTARLEV
jgi:hypothetical protein